MVPVVVRAEVLEAAVVVVPGAEAAQAAEEV